MGYRDRVCNGTARQSGCHEQSCHVPAQLCTDAWFTPARGLQNCKDSQVWVEESRIASEMSAAKQAAVLRAFAGINAAKKHGMETQNSKVGR